MLKKVIILLLLPYLLFSNQVEKKVYQITIEVAGKKEFNKSWDIAGGAPDIQVIINGKELPFEKKCKNRYRCEMVFASSAKEWYFEIYDKDIKESDLIGKGKCSTTKECNLGLAKVKIEEKGDNR